MKLYEISDEIRAIEKMMEEQGESIDLDSFRAALDGLNTALEAKIANIGLLIKELKSDQEARKAAVEQLQDANRRDENRISFFRDYLNYNMIDNVKTPLVSVSRRKGRAMVQITDEEQIPAQFKRTEVSILKSEIKKAMDDGQDVSGAVIIPGKLTVTIK